MHIKLITDVTTEPLTLDEVEAHLRIEADTQDTYLTPLITLAREYAENYTRRSLATKTLELILDVFPKVDYIELPKSPVQSVTSIKYKDYEGSETTWDSGNYIVSNDYLPAKIVLGYNKTYPIYTEYPTDSIRIRYVAGHNDSNPIPKSIKQAMLMLIGHLYENRELTSVADLNEIPFSINALLYPFKIFGW